MLISGFSRSGLGVLGGLILLAIGACQPEEELERATVLAPLLRYPAFSTSDAVVLSGLEAGTTVELFSDGEAVGQSEVRSGTQTVELSEPVVRGSVLMARVVDDGVPGPMGPVSEVQPVPDPLPSLVAAAPAFAGAWCLGAMGGVPGGRASLVDDGEELASADVGPDGAAILCPDGGLREGQQLELVLEVEGIGSTRSLLPKTVAPLRLPEEDPVPPPQPTLSDPFGCETHVDVDGLIAGARVSLSVDGEWLPEQDTVSESARAVVEALPPGALVGVRQSLAAYGVSSAGLEWEVLSAVLHPPPQVQEPIYDGDRVIRVEDLLDHAPTTVLVDGIAVGTSEAGGGSEFALPLFLQVDQRVRVEQQTCEGPVLSDEVVVLPRPTSLPMPILFEPVYEGMSSVMITNRHPGAVVQVSSDNGLIGEEAADTVPLFLTLVAGQRISAVQRAGSVASPASVPITVQTVGTLDPPTLVGPVDNCAGVASVEDVTEGARVTILAGNLVVGSQITSASALDVPLVLSVAPGWTVSAVQAIGLEVSSPSAPVTVTGSLQLSAPSPLPIPGGGSALVDVVLGCPTPFDVPVTLTGDNPDRLEVDDSEAYPNPAVVPAGGDTSTFRVFGHGTGSATLSASAPDYVGDERTVEVGGS